ncbi:MAG: hypothetical protein F9K22_12110 [Bacteroidetes bacterium]|nr:MAG: hypothetical protein F9K22_12110 [Bacteroidota bacterium]
MPSRPFRILLIAVIAAYAGCDITEVYVAPEPVVRIVEPSAVTPILDSTFVTIEASDDRGIAKVELFIDGKIPPGGTLLYEPYTYLWRTDQYADSTPHTLFARAYDTDSNVTQSAPVKVVTYRFTPSNFSASVISDTLMRFQWTDNASNETGFQLFESVNDSGFRLVQTYPANTTTADMTGIFLSGVRHDFMLRAVKDTVRSRFSNVQSLTVYLPPPSTFRIHSLTDTLVEVRWQANPASFEKRVEVELRTGNGPYEVLGSVPAGIRSFLIPRYFRSGTRHYFRARAFSAYNISPYSYVDTSSFILPAPTGIVMQAVSGGVRLGWVDNSKFEKGFAVERSVYGSGTFSEVHRTGPNDTSWTDTSLDTAKSYSWRVRAYTDSVLTGYSSTVFASHFTTVSKRIDFTVGGGAVIRSLFIPGTSDVAVASMDGAVTVVNARTGGTVRTITVGGGGVTALAVRPDGAVFAAGCNDGTVSQWNVATGTSVHSFTAHTGRVGDIAYTDAGATLVTGGADSVLRSWAASDGSAVRTFPGHVDTVTAVAVSPDGTDIVSGGTDNTVRSWNASTGAQQWSRTLPSLRINDIAYNSAGDRIAVAQSASFGNPIVLLSPATGDTAGYFNRLSNSSNAVRFGHDAISFFSSGDDGQLSLFHLSLPFISLTVPAGGTPAADVDMNGDGTLAVTARRNGTVTVWDVGHLWQKFNP